MKKGGKNMKKEDINKFPIPAGLLIGIGVGLLLTFWNPMAIPAFTLIGLGLGFLVTFLVSRKKRCDFPGLKEEAISL
jgi:predicted ABC-type sugar transport system permease subunit